MSAAKKIVPHMSLSIALWDPDELAGSDKLAHGTVECTTGAEGFADMEANAKRKADQLITEAFARARAKLAARTQGGPPS